MEVIEVVGLREVDFKDGDKVIKGTSIYYLMIADDVQGKVSGKLFVGADRRDQIGGIPAVGEKVAVSYDRYGKPTQFKPIK